ncbi:hypothetical protein E5360_10655 [Muribaculum intestinale]|nr:hypothetical protein E5360_10655 [Muribaculum intestinale]
MDRSGAGRSAPLRTLSPLRTVRDSFPSHGSSNNISDLFRNTLIFTLLFVCHTQITAFMDD